jgi:hypothetical protein
LRKGSQIVSKKKQHSKKCRGCLCGSEAKLFEKETTPQKI